MKAHRPKRTSRCTITSSTPMLRDPSSSSLEKSARHTASSSSHSVRGEGEGEALASPSLLPPTTLTARDGDTEAGREAGFAAKPNGSQVDTAGPIRQFDAAVTTVVLLPLRLSSLEGGAVQGVHILHVV